MRHRKLVYVSVSKETRLDTYGFHRSDHNNTVDMCSNTECMIRGMRYIVRRLDIVGWRKGLALQRRNILGEDVL